MTASLAAQPRHRPGSSSAFTLVELLISLGIVAVLAGLVLAGVFSARSRVGILQCSSNLQQIGMAVSLYVADYHAVPLFWYGGGTVTRLVGGRTVAEKRAPCPPWGYDIQVALGDYLRKPAMFECPIVSGYHGGRPGSGTYKCNNMTSGYTLSQIRCGAGKDLVMADCIDSVSSPWGLWHAHGCRANALFLDGHVKAYRWINYQDPFDRNIMPVDWTSSNPTTW